MGPEGFDEGGRLTTGSKLLHLVLGLRPRSKRYAGEALLSFHEALVLSFQGIGGKGCRLPDSLARLDDQVIDKPSGLLKNPGKFEPVTLFHFRGIRDGLWERLRNIHQRLGPEIWVLALVCTLDGRKILRMILGLRRAWRGSVELFVS